jgi:hypothetical protein
MLADSFGEASASAETYKALNMMHPAPGGVIYEDLVELYEEPKPVMRPCQLSTLVLISCGNA